MSNREIYLDHAATTPVDPVVADTISQIQADCFANPSSPHRAGRRAHHMLDESRGKILEYFDCPDATLIFTSGATEANYLAVHGLRNPEQTAFRDEPTRPRKPPECCTFPYYTISKTDHTAT